MCLPAEFYGTPVNASTPPDFQATDYLINFVNNLDPNIFKRPSAASLSTTIFWPPFDIVNRTMLTFLDGVTPLTLSTDDFRVEPIDYVNDLTRGTA